MFAQIIKNPPMYDSTLGILIAVVVIEGSRSNPRATAHLGFSMDFNYSALSFPHDPLFHAWIAHLHTVEYPDCNKFGASCRLF